MEDAAPAAGTGQDPSRTGFGRAGVIRAGFGRTDDEHTGDGNRDFDHTDPVAAQDIYGLLASSRERCPVLRGSNHGGFWAFSRFADVTGAANDHEHFTTSQGVTVPPLGLPIASVPLTTDPPEHKFYRRALHASL
jgi:cytochrome P450